MGERKLEIRRRLLKIAVYAVASSSLTACTPLALLNNFCAEGQRNIFPDTPSLSSERIRQLQAAARSTLKPDLLEYTSCLTDSKTNPQNARYSFEKANGTTEEILGGKTATLIIRRKLPDGFDESQVVQTIKDDGTVASTRITVLTADTRKRAAAPRTAEKMTELERIQFASSMINIPKDIQWSEREIPNTIPNQPPVNSSRGISLSSNQIIEITDIGFISVEHTP